MSNVDQAKKQILVCTRLVSFLAYAPDDQSQMQLVAVVVVVAVLATVVVVVVVARNFYSVGKFFCQRFDLISQANIQMGGRAMGKLTSGRRAQLHLLHRESD